MSGDVQYILIADYVPLANKGEEAIIRGLEDMLRDDRPIQIGLFGNVDQVSIDGNITVFPVNWISRFPPETLSVWFNRFKSIFVALQMAVGYYSRLKNLVSPSDEKYRPLQEFFKRAEYILVGHDGTFRTESCGIIHLAKKDGKRVGIVGASTGISRFGRLYKGWLYKRAIEECDFCVFRERHSQENMRQVSRIPAKLLLAPDPAFAMRPVEPQIAGKILESYDVFNKARKAGRSIVVATVLEKGTVYYHFRPELDADAKQRAHSEYLAEIFDALISKRNAFMIFLPHSIESLHSDVTAAEHVTEIMKAGPGDYMILHENLPARVLKGIINESDFLVGERLHSVIGSITVAVPFVVLTNEQDTRAYGIVGEMCHHEDRIINMNILNSAAASRRILELFDMRESFRESLLQAGKTLFKRLDEAVKIIKGHKTQIQNT
jgi:polysaccharide pyruvyl transferase WcaK-like protein